MRLPLEKKPNVNERDLRSLRRGTTGDDVRALQRALTTIGFSPGEIDGEFGAATEAALMGFQHSERLLVDGIAGPRTAASLGISDVSHLSSAVGDATIEVVSQLFPSAPLAHIEANLPPLLAALERRDLADRSMVLTALATVRAESESFLPIEEAVSRFNTSPRAHPFDLYDNRKDLGNLGPPDGATFMGRGFVQLRGRFHYREYGPRLHTPCDLEAFPGLASATEIAADLLALFLSARESEIRFALLRGNLAEVRRLVNGGTLGMDRFDDAFHAGVQLLPPRL
jgi:putative chitinase